MARLCVCECVHRCTRACGTWSSVCVHGPLHRSFLLPTEDFSQDSYYFMTDHPVELFSADV